MFAVIRPYFDFNKKILYNIITINNKGSKKTMKCCLCNCKVSGNGNDIRPLIRGRNTVCCDSCNKDIIIPLRLLEYISYRENRSTE